MEIALTIHEAEAFFGGTILPHVEGLPAATSKTGWIRHGCNTSRLHANAGAELYGERRTGLLWHAPAAWRRH